METKTKWNKIERLEISPNQTSNTVFCDGQECKKKRGLESPTESAPASTAARSALEPRMARPCCRQSSSRSLRFIAANSIPRRCAHPPEWRGFWFCSDHRRSTNGFWWRWWAGVRWCFLWTMVVVWRWPGPGSSGHSGDGQEARRRRLAGEAAATVSLAGGVA